MAGSQPPSPGIPVPPTRGIGRRRVLGIAAATTLTGLVGGGAVATWRSSTRTRLGATVEAPLSDSELAAWTADVDTLADHGLNLIRTAVHPWAVAPAMGQWDEASADFYRRALGYARQRGLAICLVVPGAPDWAQTVTAAAYLDACRWFWSRLAETFGDQIHLWQVFNEADDTHYRLFTPIKLTTTYLAELASLLGTARDILGQRGASVTTNVSGWPMDDQREAKWLTVLDALSPELDIVSVDVYPADNPNQIALLPARIDRLRQRYGRRVFVAEVGLQTAHGSWTQDEQQRYLPAAIDRLRSTELWGICLYQLRDQPDPPGFGIELADGAQKASFTDVMAALSGTGQ